MANIAQMQNRQAREKAYHPRFYDLFGKGKSLALGRAAIARLGLMPDVHESTQREMLNHFADYGFVKFSQTGVNQYGSQLLMDRKTSWQLLVAAHQAELDHAIEAGKAASIASLPAANAARTARKEAKEAAKLAAKVAASIGRIGGGDSIPPQDRATYAVITKADETVAIVGDEPEAPMSALRPARKLDDADALVEAARQYSTRRTTVEKKLSELTQLAAEMGVGVTANISMETDERLETISLVLPVLDRLQKRVERLEAEVAQNRDIVRNATDLRTQNEALRRQTQRLIAQKTLNGEAAHA